MPTPEHTPDFGSPKNDRSEYMRAYQKQYRQLKVRKEISFSPKLYERFAKEADLRGLAFNAWVRDTLSAYLDQTFLVISPQDMQQLVLAIRRIGNNINQVVKYIHSEREVTTEQVHEMLELLKELEATVEAAVQQPELLESAIRTAVQTGRITTACLSDLLTPEL